MTQEQLDIPHGAIIVSATNYQFGTEQDAAAAMPAFQSVNTDGPVYLPDGTPLRPLTNGEVFILKLIGKWILFIILMLP